MASAIAVASILFLLTLIAAAVRSGLPGEDGLRQGPAIFRMLMDCAIIPLCEEVLFREALPRLLSRWTGPSIAVIASATLFAAVHMGVGWAAWAALFIGALVLSYAYARSSNLSVPVAAHVLLNSLLTIVLASR